MDQFFSKVDITLLYRALVRERQKRRTFYTCAILPQMALFWFLHHYCGMPFKVETKCVLLYCISQSLVAKNVKFLTIKKHFIFSQLPKMSTKTHQLIMNTLYNLLGPYFQ